jgi:cellulose synthase/poly-beta-1,6-N-acetylglucosamine synthase-like glycosyltransferase
LAKEACFRKQEKNWKGLDEMDALTIIYLAMFFFGIFFVIIFIDLQLKYKKNLHDFPKPTRFPFISFLIPCYNEEGSLEETVENLARVNYPDSKKEIIIVNDGSKDNTAEIAASLGKKYDFIRVLNKPNSGKADSLNKAIKIARGELIAIVDADSFPEKNAVSKMIGYFDDKKVAAVTSRVLVKNQGNYLVKSQVIDYAIIAWTRKLLDFIDSVYVTNGPLSIYKKAYVEKIGGFDPKNLTEDIEITWHLLSKGYKVKMSYDAIVYTIVPDTLKSWINQRIRWNVGGIQTVFKYWKDMLKNPNHMFGKFVIPYVSLAFILAFVGMYLLGRYIWISGIKQFFSFFYLLQGYNYLQYMQFNFLINIISFFAILFFILSFIHYRQGFESSGIKKKTILKILSFAIIYRSLYIIPYVMSIVKYVTKDMRWYTK